MKSFEDVKGEVRADSSIEKHRYSRLLNLLPQPENDRRGTEPEWDIWYFSQNTDFCLEVAKRFHDSVMQSVIGDDLRAHFGGLCIYLYAALESFAHEANLLYGLGQKRRAVTFKRLSEALDSRPGSRLSVHVDEFLSEPTTKRLFAYRDTIAHGYVFPMSGSTDGRIVLAERPQDERFEFPDSGLELFELTQAAYSSVYDAIHEGWRCFSADELS
jgi:hypothetical protein